MNPPVPPQAPVVADASSTAVTAFKHQHELHHKPVFCRVTTNYVLEDWNLNQKVGVLHVAWAALQSPDQPSKNPNKPERAKYTVMVTRTSTDDDAVYSLYTLGVQSPRHPVKITNATGNVLVKPTEHGAYQKPKNANIPAVVHQTVGAGTTPELHSIGFLKFVGAEKSCTLDVVADVRYLYSETRWCENTQSVGDGHDTEPPENPPR